MKRPPSRRRLLWFCLLLLAVLAIPLAQAMAQDEQPETAICPPDCPVSLGVHSIFQPASPEAEAILVLHNVVLVIAVIIFVIVEGALMFAILRFRNRPPEMAMQFHGNTKLEIAWTAAPALILAVLLGYTLRTMGEVRAVTSENVIHVKAIGHQWWWEFRYLDLEPQVITANELVVPTGSVVEVALESVDVEHGFWVPELFGKVDAIPGYTTRLKFTPTAAGTYGGQCTQFCGTQHANMRFTTIVVTPAEFQTWAANQQQPAAAATGEAVAGEQAFLQGQCVACHTIAGTTAAGVIGPNLTHLGSRKFLAGGVLPNTPRDIALWLRDTQGVKPGNLMVIAPLDEQTIQNLAAYLTTLK